METGRYSRDSRFSSEAVSCRRPASQISCSISIETEMPSAMLPALAQASAALAIRAASLRREWISPRKALMASLIIAQSMIRAPSLMGTVTLRCPRKSTEFGAILWRCLPPFEHAVIGICA